MVAYAFDASGIAPEAGFTVWPDALYPVVIAKADSKANKDGRNGHLALTFKCIEGPMAGATQQYRLNIWHESEEAKRIALAELSALVHVTIGANQGRLAFNNTDELLNIPFFVRASSRKDEKTGNVYQDFSDFKDIRGNAPGAAGGGGAGGPPSGPPQGFPQPGAAPAPAPGFAPTGGFAPQGQAAPAPMAPTAAFPSNPGQPPQQFAPQGFPPQGGGAPAAPSFGQPPAQAPQGAPSFQPQPQGQPSFAPQGQPQQGGFTPPQQQAAPQGFTPPQQGGFAPQGAPAAPGWGPPR